MVFTGDDFSVRALADHRLDRRSHQNIEKRRSEIWTSLSNALRSQQTTPRPKLRACVLCDLSFAQKVLSDSPRQRTTENSPAIYRWDGDEYETKSVKRSVSRHE